MCTHHLCFEQKEEKYHNFSSENYNFYSCEKSQYIAQASFLNGSCFISDRKDNSLSQDWRKVPLFYLTCLECSYSMYV